MARSSYNTRTRQLILDYLRANPSRAVSAADIVAYLEAAGAPANPTTVYRYLDKLAADQQVMKYVADKGERALYQYTDQQRHCREHIHHEVHPAAARSSIWTAALWPRCAGTCWRSTVLPCSARAASCTGCAGGAPPAPRLTGGVEPCYNNTQQKL